VSSVASRNLKGSAQPPGKRAKVSIIKRWFLECLRLPGGCALPFVVILLANSLGAQIAITGSNGKVVEFPGIVSASPKGLTVSVRTGADWITIPWSQLKLDELQSKHPDLYKAYVDSTKSKHTIFLKLGVFSGKQLFDEAVLSVRKHLEAATTIQLESSVKAFALSSGMPLSKMGSNTQNQYVSYLESIFLVDKTTFSSVYNPASSYVKIPTNVSLLLRSLHTPSLHGKRAAFYAIRKNFHLLKPMEDTLLKLQKSKAEIVFDPGNKDSLLFEFRIAAALEALEAIKGRAMRNNEVHDKLIRFVDYMEQI